MEGPQPLTDLSGDQGLIKLHRTASISKSSPVVVWESPARLLSTPFHPSPTAQQPFLHNTSHTVSPQIHPDNKAAEGHRERNFITRSIRSILTRQ